MASGAGRCSRRVGSGDCSLSAVHASHFAAGVHFELHDALSRGGRLAVLQILEPGADGAEEALVSQEERALGALAPEADRVRQRRDGRRVPSDEAAAEVAAPSAVQQSADVHVVDAVLLRVHVGDLPDVVADRVKQAAADVFGLERALRGQSGL